MNKAPCGGLGCHSTGGQRATPDAAGDGGTCDRCSRGLPSATSLACYCAAHPCSPSLKASLKDPRWTWIEHGCGLTVLYLVFGPGAGEAEIFDSATGELKGGSRWGDVVGACATPRGNAQDAAWGGIYFEATPGSLGSPGPRAAAGSALDHITIVMYPECTASGSLAAPHRRIRMLLSPSLFFTTSCEPALAFYERCGLGTARILLRWGQHGMPVRTEAMRGKVLHARFEGPGVLFSASDNDDAEPMKGAALMLEFDDPSRMVEAFGRLSDGATITVPLARQYWGSEFGMLVDAFGVQWMFSHAPDLA